MNAWNRNINNFPRWKKTRSGANNRLRSQNKSIKRKNNNNENNVRSFVKKSNSHAIQLQNDIFRKDVNKELTFQPLEINKNTGKNIFSLQQTFVEGESKLHQDKQLIIQKSSEPSTKFHQNNNIKLTNFGSFITEVTSTPKHKENSDINSFDSNITNVSLDTWPPNIDAVSQTKLGSFTSDFTDTQHQRDNTKLTLRGFKSFPSTVSNRSQKSVKPKTNLDNFGSFAAKFSPKKSGRLNTGK